MSVGQTACRALGPFDDEGGAKRVRQRLAEKSIEAHLRASQTGAHLGYMVAVEAAKITGGTPAIITAFERHGIKDYQVLTAVPGRVSVGYYKGIRTAMARLKRMAAIGLPARLIPRSAGTPQYSLELHLPENADHQSLLGPTLRAEGFQDLPLASCRGIVTARR